jgi:hypothetical protein
VSESGVEQQGLIVVDEVLIERETCRSYFGHEGRETVDAVCDFVDSHVHGTPPFWIRWLN